VTGLETTRTFALRDYDLAASFNCGQVFRWAWHDPYWLGVIGGRWVRLRAGQDTLTAETAEAVSDWEWLTHYLQLEVDLKEVLRTFPDDEPLRAAVSACRGLRLLRQEPWECLASFILSSTKQILQIRQIVGLLCDRYGGPLAVARGCPPAFAFPSPVQLARATEPGLRACRMGFRAPYLRATARLIADAQFDLVRVQGLPLEAARSELMQLPGVGRKIADCVLLFAYGFQSAFPVDVWVMKALRQLYFPRRRVTARRLYRFAADHFGPRAGYAQQYLFHYMRMRISSPGMKPFRSGASRPRIGKHRQTPRCRALAWRPSKG
jgi:N-glycosylase/DNA lyase